MSKNENENFQKNPNQHSGYVWNALVYVDMDQGIY